MKQKITPIYTEQRICQDCYKCIRHCPVKAIHMESGSAIIDHKTCIYCGRCYRICPVKAKKIRNDVGRVQKMIRAGKRVVCSLSPSFFTYSSREQQQRLYFLHSVGIDYFEETAIGAEVLTSGINQFLQKTDQQLVISTACPVVVELVNRYYPDFKEGLMPLASPALIHGRMLRQQYGKDVGIIFIAPCIGKKQEIDRYGTIDVVITFDELNRWMEQGDIDRKRDKLHLKIGASGGVTYPLEGGMIRLLSQDRFRTVSISGVGRLKRLFDEMMKGQIQQSLLIEALGCPGGCVNGAATDRACSFFDSAQSLELLQIKRVPETYRVLPEILIHHYNTIEPCHAPVFKSAEIEDALKTLGKVSPGDQLNCGGCGYDSCIAFARALLAGHAEREMCVGHMRKLAEKKVDALIKTIPLGAVIVDDQMNIIECNHVFVSMFSDGEIDDHTRINTIMAGLPVFNFIPVEQQFQKALEGISSVEQITEGSMIVKGTFFTIEAGRLAGALFHDVTFPTLKRETIIKKADRVIRRNLESVQQIAALLGENAAETEIILNSVIEALKPSGVQ